MEILNHFLPIDQPNDFLAVFRGHFFDVGMINPLKVPVITPRALFHLVRKLIVAEDGLEERFSFDPS